MQESPLGNLDGEESPPGSLPGQRFSGFVYAFHALGEMELCEFCEFQVLLKMHELFTSCDS